MSDSPICRGQEIKALLAAVKTTLVELSNLCNCEADENSLPVHAPPWKFSRSRDQKKSDRSMQQLSPIRLIACTDGGSTYSGTTTPAYVEAVDRARPYRNRRAQKDKLNLFLGGKNGRNSYSGTFLAGGCSPTYHHDPPKVVFFV